MGAGPLVGLGVGTTALVGLGVGGTSEVGFEVGVGPVPGTHCE